LVLTDLRFGFGRETVRGVLDYAREHPPWTVSVRMVHDRPIPPNELPHAVIFTTDFRELADVFPDDLVRKVACSPAEPDMPLQVILDGRAAGRLAADHFVNRGFRRFAFTSYWTGPVARARATGFFGRLSEHGCRDLYVSPDLLPFIADANVTTEVQAFEIERDGSFAANPLAVLAFNDRRAADMAGELKQHGFRLPDEVAVMGADNDDLFCETVSPALSSIDTNSRQAGRAAARLAVETRRSPRPRVVMIPPAGIVTRESTDILAVEDTVVRRALRQLQQSVGAKPDWNRIAALVGVGRRTLEIRFRRALKRSPGEELRRLRMEHAAHLLLTTRLPSDEVCRACGYATPTQFYTAFRRFSGTTPGAFRTAHGR
jgi:LacI family transcriptional regulator